MSAADLNLMWAEYGNAGGHWTGGDGSASVPLPDGRVAWIFADTFLGTVNADFSRPTTTPLINNTMVVQNGSQLGPTLFGGTSSSPAALVKPANPDEWYWVGDGTVVNNTLQVLYGRYTATDAAPPLAFALKGTGLATFSLPGLTLTSVRDLPVSGTIGWGSALLEDGSYTYIYGTESAGGLKYLHLARVANGDLNSEWSYWTGSGWSTSEASSARLMSGVGEGMSVTKAGDQYVLVTQDNNEVFSSWIVAYVATSATGPFTGPKYVHRAPEPEIDNQQFVYNARVHPEFSPAGKLLISYDVNTFDGNKHYSDVNIYRPRFVEVPWPPPTPAPGDIPPAPTNLTVRATSDNAAHLRWTAASGSNLSYWVYRRDLTSGQSHLARVGYDVTETEYYDTGLKANHDYAYQVRTITTADVESAPTPLITIRGKESAPPAPTGLSATAGTSGQVSLSWTGSEADVRYQVYRRDLTEGETVFAADSSTEDPYATTQVVTDLVPGHKYEFHVKAVNSVGESLPSNAVQATSTYAPPPAPTALTATALGDGSVKLTWNGGSSPQFFVHRRDVTSGETTFTKLDVPVEGASTIVSSLLSGHTYEFKLSAQNDGGESPATAAVSATVRFDPPNAPTGLVATPQADGTVKLTWTAPATGNPAMTYWVYRRDLTFGHTTFSRFPEPTATTSSVVDELFNGNTFEFKVTAVGDGGEGPASTVATATARVTPPAAPTGLAAYTGDTAVTLEWNATVGAGVYWVYQRDVTAGETSFTRLAYPTDHPSSSLGWLTNGHIYEYKVAGINDAGTGAASAVVRVTPQAPLPPKVTGVAGTAEADGTVSLQWNAIPDVYYWVYYRDVTAGETQFTRFEYPATSASAQVGPFTAGHELDFAVAATKSTGDGAMSAPARVTIAGSSASATVKRSPGLRQAEAKATRNAIRTDVSIADLPYPPQNLQVDENAPGYVDLRWDPVPNGPVYYWIQFRSEGRSEWYQLPYPTVHTSQRVSGFLWPGYQYHFRVVAQNNTGVGGPSNTVSVVAKHFPPPPRPTSLSATGFDEEVFLDWNPVPYSFYWVEFKSSGTSTWYRLAYPAVESRATIRRPLWLGYKYDFRIVAFNPAGESEPSAAVSATPEIPDPEPPSSLSAVTDVGGIWLNWTRSPTKDVYYWVYYAPSGSTLRRTKYPISANFMRLAYLPSGYYTVAVSAVNRKGESRKISQLSVYLGGSRRQAYDDLTSSGFMSRWRWNDAKKAAGHQPFTGYDFDWSSDLCSPPGPDQFTIWNPSYPWLRADIDFRMPCSRHDFGYRNGKKFKWWSSRQRYHIDAVFLADMKDACDTQADHRLYPTCSGIAQVYHAFSRKVGR